MAFQGMDVQQVRKASDDTESRAAEIDKLIDQLDSEAQKVDWRGEDSQRFKTTDWPACRDQAKELSKLLRQIAQTLDENANDQERVTSQ